MRIVFAGSAVLCVAIGFFAGASFGSSQAKAKVTNLLQAPLDEDFAPGREVLVDRVEIPPGTSLDRHWHPGEEFHYYLAGDPEVLVEGKGLVRPALGTVGHVTYETRHRAGAGAAGATILVFRIHEKGKPWRYLEDEAREGQDAVRK
jgi:quercetin dioxygenase-like cupin family protein